MTQEDKEILLRDLSARLPYGVKVKLTLSDGTSFEDTLLTYKRLENWLWDNTPHNKLYEGIRPYLRPMSSMTEEEKDEYDRLVMCNASWIVDDWLNKNQFDYRGLISKGLAIAVTKENNPYED